MLKESWQQGVAIISCVIGILALFFYAVITTQSRTEVAALELIQMQNQERIETLRAKISACVDGKENCDPNNLRAQIRDAADLLAQQRMADAAEGLERLTFWQIVLGVLGTTSLLGTLYYARTTIEISDDTAKRQLRAYVGVKHTSLDIIAHQKLQARITFYNYGTTPADVISGSIKMFVTRIPISSAELENLVVQDYSHTIFPHDTLEVEEEHPALTEQEDLLIRGGYTAIYLWGSIAYKDIYGRRQFSEFRFSISNNGDLSSKTFRAELDGNRST